MNNYMNNMFKHAKIGTILHASDFQKLYETRIEYLMYGDKHAFTGDKYYLKTKNGWVEEASYDTNEEPDKVFITLNDNNFDGFDMSDFKITWKHNLFEWEWDPIEDENFDVCTIDIHSNGSKNSVLFDSSSPLPFPMQTIMEEIEDE